MTIGARDGVVKVMRMTDKQVQRLVHFVFKSLKDSENVEFKQKEDQVFDRAVAIIKEELQREVALDREVNAMMDDLERQNPGSFERYKMFPLLKKRLAKEKGMVL